MTARPMVTYHAGCAQSGTCAPSHAIGAGDIVLLVALLAAAFYFAIVADRLRR